MAAANGVDKMAGCAQHARTCSAHSTRRLRVTRRDSQIRALHLAAFPISEAGGPTTCSRVGKHPLVCEVHRTMVLGLVYRDLNYPGVRRSPDCLGCTGQVALQTLLRMTVFCLRMGSISSGDGILSARSACLQLAASTSVRGRQRPRPVGRRTLKQIVL